jgi:hypothetical protein
MESALFRLNSFSTCAGTVSAISRVWKSWSDLFRHQCINPRNRPRGGNLSTVCGYQRAVIYAFVVRQQAAVVVPTADTQVARR